MSPERWGRIKSVLSEALEMDPGYARDSFVSKICADDITLRRDVERLLRQSNEDVEEFADHLRSSLLTRIWSEPAGQSLGAYRIVREIGRGGMGAVYLAARADGQFEKDVAIKLLKRGTDTDEILRRFRAERQILARLDHPSIARLLDAGTAEDGLPYFVMEYVLGIPVTRFVEEHQLSLADRLELFSKICAAVESAHQSHVVHRDLKPSNILVTAAGEPKLLDFGIAKFLAAGEDQTRERTLTWQQRLTPSYASPEQARGEPVTPASDIYALGTLLYEILTGQTPHRFSIPPPSLDEVARVLSTQEPIAPSLAVSDAEMRRKLRGDLDNMVLVALRKEPERRYGSVAELTGDLDRYRAGRPVQARPNTFAYRLQRFASRHRRGGLRVLLASSAMILIAAITLSAFLFFYPGARGWLGLNTSPRSGGIAAIPEKSIAVLPFANLSAEKENAFFADGVQSEILTALARVADLKVISRDSVLQFESGRPRNLNRIGRTLGVVHVLEGTVERMGNRVRVLAQLVDTRTGMQVWADRYDRELADVFAIQNEIAQEIARQLQANLTSGEKAAIEEHPTNDMVAYDLYLQAKESVNRYLYEQDPDMTLRKAVRWLDEATERDPAFALAYCYAARAHSLLFFLDLDPTLARIANAEKAVNVALRLRPHSAEAHLANADFYFRCHRDYAKARQELDRARPGLPNSTPFYMLTGYLDRRQARWLEAERNFAKAVELDPQNPFVPLSDNEVLMRNYAKGIRTLEQEIDAGQTTPLYPVRIGWIRFMATGDIGSAQAALAKASVERDPGGGVTPFRVLIALIDQDYSGAAKILAASSRTDFQDADFTFYYPRAWYEAQIARASGNQAEAKRAFATARSILEARLKLKREDPRTLVALAQVDAGLGNKELAIREGRRAVDLMPIAKDAYDGPLVLQGLAQVYTWTGEPDRAVDLVQTLVQLPGYLAYGYLLRDPCWAPLRGDPRFEKLVSSLGPIALH